MFDFMKKEKYIIYKKRRQSMKIKAVVYIFFLFLFIAFGSGTVSGETPFVSIKDKDGVQRIEILSGEYFFKPAHIIVKVNAPVEITIKKEPGIVPHNIVLKAPEAGIDISESIDNKPKTIRFTPLKTGTYTFYCDKKLLFMKSHREKGMEGVLEVVR